MTLGNTAILQLRSSATPLALELIRGVLSPLRGIFAVEIDRDDQVVAVRFDERATNAAEIVRLIEDLGMMVSSVATRHPDSSPDSPPDSTLAMVDV